MRAWLFELQKSKDDHSTFFSNSSYKRLACLKFSCWMSYSGFEHTSQRIILNNLTKPYALLKMVFLNELTLNGILFHHPNPAVHPSFPNLLLSPEMEFLYHLGSAHKVDWTCIQSSFLSMIF